MHKYLYLRLGVTTYNVVLSCTPVGASPTQFSHLPATHEWHPAQGKAEVSNLSKGVSGATK